MSLRQSIDFFLYDWLHVDTLCARDRFLEHGKETFVAVLDI
jgi:butyryl-CoA dehydrogenase